MEHLLYPVKDIWSQNIHNLYMPHQVHNIIQIHSIVLIVFHKIFSHIQTKGGNIWEYFVEYCQPHITLLWIWILLCLQSYSYIVKEKNKTNV